MNNFQKNDLSTVPEQVLSERIMDTFESFQLNPEIFKAIAEMGFKTPTPVQSRCYERAVSGGDAIIMAQTGTGKTAAFGIPLLQAMDLEVEAVQALILVPTRELALQVTREIESIARYVKVTCAPIYGGASFSAQADMLNAGARIVVGTPGRILDHIRRKTLQFHSLSTLVLDEADEMLSMGFEKELSEIMENLPRKRQTLLFSATIPDDIKRLSGKYMDDALTISVSGDQVASSQLTHFVYLLSGIGRTRDLIRIIEVESPDSAIVFCNTRDETQTVASSLQQAGFNAEHISSDLSQAEREKVMAATREGNIRFLVATDVAARGIDISHLTHVINYSFPDSPERYIHRTGRAGRQGREGSAFSLITPQDIGNLYMLRLTYRIFPIEKELPTTSTQQKQNELVRLTALRNDSRDIRIEDIWTELSDRLLQSVDAVRLVSFLLQSRFGNETASPSTRKALVSEPESSVVENIRESDDAKLMTPASTFDADPEESASEIRSGESEFCARVSVTPNFDDVDASTDIFFDAGRKDGLRISALMKDLVEKSGLQRTDIGKVRMLTRCTFITVTNRYCRQVHDVLSEILVNGQKVKVDYAKST